LSTRDEEGLLSRWSRRRLEVREAEEREAQEIAAREAEQAEAQALLADPEQRDMPPDDETRQKWIEELEQIDIDSLSYDNDFTIFMKSWVPGALRQRALRKLWTTNPTLAVLDGLNDYDLDYTDAAMGAGKVISSWSPQGGYAKLEELTEKVSELAAEAEDTSADNSGAEEDDLPVFDDTPAPERLAGDDGNGEPAGEEVASSKAEDAKPPRTTGQG
jgi:hypothetical protein